MSRWARAPETQPRAARVRAWLTRAVDRVRSSVWAGPAAKVLLAALALGVLSAIGGSALAGVASADGASRWTPTPTTGPPDARAADPATVPTTSATVLAETVIEARPGDAGAQAAPGPTSAKASAESPVALNSATLEDLRRLPGIGPKKAEAILALRAKLGRFRRPEELMRVKGIGRGTFKKLRPLVRVDEPPAT